VALIVFLDLHYRQNSTNNEGTRNEIGHVWLKTSSISHKFHKLSASLYTVVWLLYWPTWKLVPSVWLESCTWNVFWRS